MTNAAGTEVFCAQVAQIETLRGTKNSTVEVGTQRTYLFLQNIQRTRQPIGTLLLSFDRRLMQNIKTSVDSILNSSSTDVFIFSDKRLSNDNKRVPIGSPVELYFT